MKKLGVSEVSSVVGGAGSNTSTCTVSYRTDNLNVGSIVGVSVCKKVTTCEGKHGAPVVTVVPVDLASCAA